MIIDLTKKIKVLMPESKAMFPYSNSIYVNDDILTVLDAGTGKRVYSDIPAEDINLLLLSHNHVDHVNGTSFFKKAKIMAGQEEAETYFDANSYWKHFGSTEWDKLMGNVNGRDVIQRVVLPKNIAIDIPVKSPFNPVELGGLFVDGDEFDLGKTKVRVIHTPGHSKGHYAFFFAKEGILFSADIDLAPRGPWYGAGSSDIDEFINSIKKIINIQPGILVTSHRKKVFNSKEDNIPKLLKQYLDEILIREDEMLGYLSEPRTIDEICRQDFARGTIEKAPYAIFWNKMMVTKHLGRLIKLNLIKKVDDDCYVRN